MPLLTPSERSALEVMLRRQLGSGAGTTVMLKVFDYVSESYVEPTPEVDMPSGTGTAEYDNAPLISQLTDVPPLNAAVEVTESSP